MPLNPALRQGFNPVNSVAHPQLGVVPYRVHQISSDPDSQVRDTLHRMRGKVANDSENPLFASRIRRMFDVRMYPHLNGTGEDEVELCRGVWAHTKQNIKFQRDEKTGAGVGGYPEEEVVETIICPMDMAGFIDAGTAIGDCDDFSMYEACCLKSLGIPCSFVTVAADSREPRLFSHVYVVAFPRDPQTGQRFRLPLDASHGEYPGWETVGLGRYEEWPVWDKFTWWAGNAVLQGLVVIGLVYLLHVNWGVKSWM